MFFIFEGKKYLPTLTVTEASPAIDMSVSVDKDSSQYLSPSPVAGSSETSCQSSSNSSKEKRGKSFVELFSGSDLMETSEESRPVTPQRKKQSRYPCRRAQRPVKIIETKNS